MESSRDPSSGRPMTIRSGPAVTGREALGGSMRRLALGMALALFSTVAHAGDFCFNSTSPPNPAPPTNPDVLVVAKRFKFPRKGSCSPVVGFETASISSDPPTVLRPVSGSVCLDAAGTLLRAGFTLHEVYDSAVNNSSAVHPELKVGMDIPYPSLTNGFIQVRTVTNDDLVRQDVLVGPCSIPFF